MIRVAANLAWLVPGRVGGSEEYTVRLLGSVIEAEPPDIDLTLLGSPALFAAHPELRGVEWVELGGPLQLRPWRIVSESTSVHRATRDADVVHHFGGRVPARHHSCNVVTIHDLQPLQLPANFSALKRRFLGAALPRSVRAASLVLTPSQWVRSTVIDLLGAEPEAVRAVSSTWDPATDSDSSVAESLGDGPVILYPAVTHPHKRHELLIDALSLLARETDGVTLVMTGGTGRAESTVRSAVERSAARIVRAGRVSPAELRGLYRRADVLAFPSAYEGFGLPVLEAMRAGVPVVASAGTALTEVVGDTGTLIEGSEPAVWADALQHALARGSVVESQVDAARIRAERWSPAVAAERLVAAWRSIS